jgi:hypothetical protein
MMHRAHTGSEQRTAGSPAGGAGSHAAAHASPESASRLCDDPEIERMIAARAEAVRWRFRLVVAESVMMALLVLVAGLLLHRPSPLVLGAAALAGLGSLAAGMLLIALTAAMGRVVARLGRRRMR